MTDKKHQAYLDIIDLVEPTSEDEEYLEAYYMWKDIFSSNPLDGETDVDAILFKRL